MRYFGSRLGRSFAGGPIAFEGRSARKFGAKTANNFGTQLAAKIGEQNEGPRSNPYQLGKSWANISSYVSNPTLIKTYSKWQAEGLDE